MVLSDVFKVIYYLHQSSCYVCGYICNFLFHNIFVKALNSSNNIDCSKSVHILYRRNNLPKMLAKKISKNLEIIFNFVL